MGLYINPGNQGFARIRNAEYVDKSGLVAYVNSVLDTPQHLVCSTRPRRFGKSFAAKMLAAYYDGSCDSSALFDDLAVARTPAYRVHLNAYHVILLDMTDVVGRRRKGTDIASEVERLLLDELCEEFPGAEHAESLGAALVGVAERTGRRFVFIIDEWDAPFREESDDTEAQRRYVGLLCSLFKNANVTSRAFATAYITGILPIKKYGTQSAVSDFREFTMVRPGVLAPYVGFTEQDVVALCERHGMDFDEMRRWYDGYRLPGAGSVYSPNSVMEAVRNRAFASYWSASETYTLLRDYIDMDFDGLQQAVVQMLGGTSLSAETLGFQNDMTSIASKDDVLTLLVHLGYLAYDEAEGTVKIPNEEIRREFAVAVEQGSSPELVRFVRASRQLLADTVAGNEEAVAAAIQHEHDRQAAPLFYNNEQALRATVKTAYVAAMDQYVRIEELPSGHGYADILYLPKRTSPYPALLVELKWNKASGTAIDQIRQRRYPAVLEGFGGTILLVGISYDEKTAQHSCSIETL